MIGCIDLCYLELSLEATIDLFLSQFYVVSASLHNIVPEMRNRSGQKTNSTQ